MKVRIAIDVCIVLSTLLSCPLDLGWRLLIAAAMCALLEASDSLGTEMWKAALAGAILLLVTEILVVSQAHTFFLREEWEIDREITIYINTDGGRAVRPLESALMHQGLRSHQINAQNESDAWTKAFAQKYTKRTTWFLVLSETARIGPEFVSELERSLSRKMDAVYLDRYRTSVALQGSRFWLFEEGLEMKSAVVGVVK